MTWNKIKTPFKALVVVAIVALSVWLAWPVQQKIHLGLDLRGGSRLLLQLYPTADVPQITSQTQEETLEVIDRRINGLGVAEPTITKVGGDRILVELPEVKDPAQAEKVLKQVAVLEFKIVPEDVRSQADAFLNYEKAPNAKMTDKQKADAETYLNTTAYAKSGPVVYSGKDLKAAQAAFSQQSNQPIVTFQTKDPKKFGAMTTANVNKPLGIFLDGRYVSAPTINSPIFDSGEINGNFTQEDTITLANELDAGALPVSVKIVNEETIGPTLGKIDLVKSMYASMLGLGVVLLFMIAFYRLPGVLADLALVIYVMIMLALFALSGATLTLPGIAGFVLSIGMAVDANVLIFERIKEELWNGKTLRAAVRVGFSRAFSAVFDSHFTTIVGAGVLFMLGTGTVKGFAFTLFWGTVFSLATAVFITRFFVDALVESNLLTAPELYGIKRDEVGIFAKTASVK
jgi:preprotein translocase subunit SecD